MKNFLHDSGKALQYLLFFGGLIGLTVGAGEIYRPLYWLMGGLFAVFVAFLMANDDK